MSNNGRRPITFCSCCCCCSCLFVCVFLFYFGWYKGAQEQGLRFWSRKKKRRERQRQCLKKGMSLMGLVGRKEEFIKPPQQLAYAANYHMKPILHSQPLLSNITPHPFTLSPSHWKSMNDPSIVLYFSSPRPAWITTALSMFLFFHYAVKPDS